MATPASNHCDHVQCTWRHCTIKGTVVGGDADQATRCRIVKASGEGRCRPETCRRRDEQHRKSVHLLPTTDRVCWRRGNPHLFEHAARDGCISQTIMPGLGSTASDTDTAPTSLTNTTNDASHVKNTAVVLWCLDVWLAAKIHQGLRSCPELYSRCPNLDI